MEISVNAAAVKILIWGYAVEDLGQEKTCPRITLVEDKDVVMVVDPGVLEDQKILIDKLKEDTLTINDVNIGGITHSHLHHCRNIGIFSGASTIEYWGLWHKSRVEDWQEQFTEDIRVIKTREIVRIP